MKTKEFKGNTSQNAAKANSLILNVIEYSCAPFNSWFETHSRLSPQKLRKTFTPELFFYHHVKIQPKHFADYKIISTFALTITHGSLAEWLGTGLQNRLQQFDSARNLKTFYTAKCGRFFISGRH